jgi:hypothetical protein
LVVVDDRADQRAGVIGFAVGQPGSAVLVRPA